MKAQHLTSFLFCVLISSTLAHEYFRAKELSHSLISPSQISPFEERVASSSPQQCTYVCNSTTTTTTTNLGLKLLANATAELVAIFNSTAQVALVIDVNAGLVVIFDGSNGAAIAVNIRSENGVYIAAGVSSYTWNANDECFKSFFDSLTGLGIFLTIGSKFSVKTISDEISTVLGKLLGALSKVISALIKEDAKEAITILLNLTSSIVTLLTGVLKGLLGFVGQTITHLAGDVLWLVAVLQGIAEVVGSITGGLAGLIKDGVHLDLNVLLGSTNGLELLINLLLSIVSRVSLGVVGTLLSTVENLVNLIVQLGGGVSDGITGVFKVVADIIALIQGKIEITAVIGTLVEFSATRNVNETLDVTIYIDGLVKVLEIQNTTHSSSANLTGLASIVSSLQNGTLTIDGVNLSSIISLLVGVVGSALELVVNVLLALSEVVKVVVSIPSLLLYIIEQLTTTVGSLLVQALIPGLKLGGEVLKTILSNLSLSKIVQLIAGGVVNLLENLPVIGDIYKAIASALSSASKGSLNLDVVLKSSNASGIVGAIENLIKGVFNSSSTASSNSTASNSTTTGGSSWSWIYPWGSHGNVSISLGGNTTTSSGNNSSSSSHSASSWNASASSNSSNSGWWHFGSNRNNDKHGNQLHKHKQERHHANDH